MRMGWLGYAGDENGGETNAIFLHARLELGSRPPVERGDMR